MISPNGGKKAFFFHENQLIKEGNVYLPHFIIQNENSLMDYHGFLRGLYQYSVLKNRKLKVKLLSN